MKLLFLIAVVLLSSYANADDRMHGGLHHKTWSKLRRTHTNKADASVSASERFRMSLMAMSHEELVQMVMQDDDEIAEMINTVGEQTGPPSKFTPLTASELAPIRTFMTAHSNALSPDMSTAAGLDQFTNTIPPASSFVELSDGAGVGLSALEDLVDIGNHALGRSPNLANGEQYTVVYGLDADDTWWTYKKVFGVVGQSHSEVLAYKDGVFAPDRWPKPFTEILLFTYNSPCTTNHGKGSKIIGCKDLVVTPLVELYGGKIGLTVMMYDWYANGWRSAQPPNNVAGAAAQKKEYEAYLADKKLVQAAIDGSFQLVMLDSGTDTVKTMIPPSF